MSFMLGFILGMIATVLLIEAIRYLDEECVHGFPKEEK